MRSIELSNHPGAQLREIQQERVTAEEQARSDHAHALAQHGRDLAELRQRRDTARAQHRWWAWLRWAVAAGRARRAVPRSPMVMWQPSPSRQLNEPATALETFLASRGQPVPVQRLVLLTHPRSRLGTCRNLTVSIATSTDEVVALLNNSQVVLDTSQLRQLEQLIVRDHQFHHARRSRSRRR